MPPFQRPFAGWFVGIRTPHGPSWMVLLKILLAGWLLPPSLGDGPSEASTTTSTTTSTTSDPNAASTTSDPNIVNISGASPDVCNPYRGYRYISIGAAGGIASGTCGASWDLYEVEMWETYTAAGRVSGLQASSPTGHDSGYPPAKAVDGSMDSFWAGDHDVGMSLPSLSFRSPRSPKT